VPFFVGRKQVKIVAACRARSLAITSDNQVYEWGFNADGDE
jgi:alpha-tubulin suppressor-like RCC1 family protein